MKPKTMILMVVAVVCGLVASYLTSRMLAQNKDTGSEEEKVKVLVAKQKIPMGTKIKEPEKLFIEKEFTKGTEPKHAITSYDQLRDKSLNKTISAEVHVTPDDLLKKEEMGLQEEIAPGMRAVAIQVKSDTNVGGFILPHSRVDVVSTSRENGLLSQIILQDVLVLAVDQMHVRDGDKTAVPSSTVTLQVKPEDAERLALAGNLGELRLILRGADDHDAVHTHGVKPTDVVHSSSTNSSVGGQDDAPAGGAGVTAGSKIPELPAVPATGPGAKPEPEPVLQTHTLTIYNGEVPTKAVFVLGDKNNEASTRIERTPLEPVPPREEKKSADPAAPKSDKDTTESTPKKDLKESESTTSRRPGK
jgi:pilus assembly protein CpaB